jgi:tetratricopeptide (TPR) repeat protein
MSLLLDALKKAELAKQIAKADSPAEPAATDPAQAEAAPRVITREKLPDITQPLEILTDDLPSSGLSKPVGAAAVRPELSLEDEPPYAPATQAAAAMNPSEPASRAQAEQLFQVKEMEYSPHRPFYLTLAALGVVAAGYGGYVWWQMRPQYSFPAPAASAPAPAVAVAPAPAPAPQPPVAAAAPVQPPPSAAPAASVQVIPPIQPVRRQPRQTAAAATTSVPRAETPVAAPADAAQAASPPIAVNARIMSVDPAVEQGYQAFQKNDLAAARESYQKALAREPNNRDALLGLAAIDVRSGQLEAAEARYLKVLEADPRDSQATAALVSLRGRLDPVASESRLKTLIASQPDVAQLHFALGNQYSHQSRWSEAQAAYFKAYTIDSQNADYAFNLAVSLDQLRQKKAALEYYQRALALAGNRPASFDSAQARLRVQELSKLPAP